MTVCRLRLLVLIFHVFLMLAAHASAPSDPPPAGTFLPQERHRRLDRLVCQERSEEAIEMASALLDSFPGDFVLTDLAIRAVTDAGQVEEGFGFLEAFATSSGLEGLQAFVRAELLLSTGRKEEALTEFVAARAACRLAGDSLGLAVVLLRNADCLSALKRAEDAVPILRQAAALAAAAGVPRYELLCADALAGCLEKLGQWREGLDHMIAALDLARTSADWCLAGRLLNNIGRGHYRLGEYEVAADRYREAAEIARERGEDRKGISRAARTGNALARLGRIGEALEQYEGALRWVRECGHHDLERRILRDIGSAHRRSGNAEKALEDFDEALALLGPNEAGSAEAARLALFKANALNDIGRFREARALLGESRRIETSDRGLLRGIFNALGNSFTGLGEIDSAVAYYREALELARQTSDRSPAGLCLGNLAGCLTLQGRFEEAIAKYGEAAALFVETGRAIELSQTHLNIAAIYSSLGRGDLAEQRCEKALSILHEHELRTHLSGCLITLGTVYKNRGEFDKARDTYLRASEEAEATGTTTDITRAFVFLGELARLQENLEEAAAHFRSALSRARDSGECRLEIRSLVGLGRVELANDDPEAARDHFQHALDLADRTKSERLRINPVTGLAEAQRALGRDEEALQSYQTAIRAIERVRAGVGSEEERRTYFSGRAHVYTDALALLWRGAGTAGGKEIELWNLAESYRARTFSDLLEEQAVDPDRFVSPALASERREILARHNRLHSRLVSRVSELTRGMGGNRDQAFREDELVLSLSAQVDSLNEAYDRIEGRIRQARMASSGGDEFSPASIPQVAELLAEGTTLLMYLVADENVFLFHLTRAGSLAVREFSTDGLAGVAELTTLLRQGKSPSTFDVRRFAELAWGVFRDYVKPAGLDWEATKRLVIVRDGPLAQIPFEVLLTRPPDDSRPEDPAEILRQLPYLFRACGVSYVPSATSLLRVCSPRAGSADGFAGAGVGDAAERPPGKTARYWVLVDPQYGEPASVATGEVVRGSVDSFRPYDFSALPHSLEEGLAILSRAGEGRCVIHQGSSATEERVKSGEMERHERIHIAAHAYLNEESPLLSALVLAQDTDPREDGFLTMREIYDLRLDADLVVLSSCETAAGKEYQGEGVVALARPFLAVGARSTVVSLWRVDDRSTASWMDSFYETLTRHDNKEKALADAREAMLRSRRPLWRLPYYWAPFILVGDYR